MECEASDPTRTAKADSGNNSEGCWEQSPRAGEQVAGGVDLVAGVQSGRTDPGSWGPCDSYELRLQALVKAADWAIDGFEGQDSAQGSCPCCCGGDPEVTSLPRGSRGTPPFDLNEAATQETGEPWLTLAPPNAPSQAVQPLRECPGPLGGLNDCQLEARLAFTPLPLSSELALSVDHACRIWMEPAAERPMPECQISSHPSGEQAQPEAWVEGGHKHKDGRDGGAEWQGPVKCFLSPAPCQDDDAILTLCGQEQSSDDDVISIDVESRVDLGMTRPWRSKGCLGLHGAPAQSFEQGHISGCDGFGSSGSTASLSSGSEDRESSRTVVPVGASTRVLGMHDTSDVVVPNVSSEAAQSGEERCLMGVAMPACTLALSPAASQAPSRPPSLSLLPSSDLQRLSEVDMRQKVFALGMAYEKGDQETARSLVRHLRASCSPTAPSSVQRVGFYFLSALRLRAKALENVEQLFHPPEELRKGLMTAVANYAQTSPYISIPVAAAARLAAQALAGSRCAHVVLVGNPLFCQLQHLIHTICHLGWYTEGVASGSGKKRGVGERGGEAKVAKQQRQAVKSSRWSSSSRKQCNEMKPGESWGILGAGAQGEEDSAATGAESGRCLQPVEELCLTIVDLECRLSGAQELRLRQERTTEHLQSLRRTVAAWGVTLRWSYKAVCLDNLWQLDPHQDPQLQMLGLRPRESTVVLSFFAWSKLPGGGCHDLPDAKNLVLKWVRALDPKEAIVCDGSWAVNTSNFEELLRTSMDQPLAAFSSHDALGATSVGDWLRVECGHIGPMIVNALAARGSQRFAVGESWLEWRNRFCCNGFEPVQVPDDVVEVASDLLWKSTKGWSVSSQLGALVLKHQGIVVGVASRWIANGCRKVSPTKILEPI